MLKKTIIVAALVTSSVATSSVFAGTLKTLVNVNQSSQYLAIGGPGACSIDKLGEAGVVAPGKQNTSHALQIYAVCNGKLPCQTTLYAFKTDPVQAGKTCTDGTKIGVSTLTGSSINIFGGVADASVSFNSSTIPSGWTITPMQSIPDAQNTITFTIK